MEGAEPGSRPVLEEPEVARECGAGDTLPADPVPSGRSGAPGARSPVGSSPGRAQTGPEMRSPSPDPPGPAHLLCHLTLIPSRSRARVPLQISEGNSGVVEPGLTSSLSQIQRLRGPGTSRMGDRERMRYKNLSGEVSPPPPPPASPLRQTVTLGKTPTLSGTECPQLQDKV